MNAAFDFDGATYVPEQDQARLSTQLLTVRRVMFRHLNEYLTPDQLEALTGYRWASISARLRDLRKSKFGGFDIERQSRGKGQWAYRLVL